jgi:hypothetical protein
MITLNSAVNTQVAKNNITIFASSLIVRSIII